MRRVAVIAMLAATALAGQARAAAPRFSAQVKEVQTLMPGVSYQRLVQFTSHGPVVYHVLTAPRPGGLYALRPELAQNALVGRGSVTDIQKGVAAQATVAGVADDVRGVLLRDGVLDSAPNAKRSSVGIDAAGLLRVERISYNGYWRGSGQRRPLQLNTAPTKNSTTLYTPAWGAATPVESGPVVAEVLASFPATAPNADLTGTVAQVVSSGGGVPIPPGGAVLVARGTQVQPLSAESQAGSTLLVRLPLTPSWTGVTDALGGGPLIVRGGKPVFRANELFSTADLSPRSPRSAVGQLADGRIVLVAVDGGQPGYSVGVSNFELALALQQLGCVAASALGSGASTAMAFQGQLLSKPSDPAGERQVAAALLIQYFGVYAAAPAVDVLSPNGDGTDELQTLAYTLVRHSTVAVSLIGPDGESRPIDSGPKDAGTYTFTWTGLRADGTPEPEGRYQFVVDATDDRGQVSSGSRSFTLDETVGFLVAPSSVVVRKTGDALRGTFQLVHPALVTATIATQSGVTVRTLFRERLQPGAQTVTWDGRTGSALAFGGSYRLVVSAQSEFGTAVVAQSLTVRRG